MPSIEPPDYGQHCLFLGDTSSGKTILAREMLSAGYHYVVIDTKGDFPLREGDYVITDPEDRLWKSKRPPPRIVYRPLGEHGDPAWVDWTLAQCYRRAQRAAHSGHKDPFIMLVDEALYLAQTGHVRWLSAAAVSGRSIGLTLWCGSQRPKFVPIQVRSNSYAWFIFTLAYEDDEKEVVKYAKGKLTVEELHESTQHFGFIEMKRDPHRAGARIVTRYPPVVMRQEI